MTSFVAIPIRQASTETTYHKMPRSAHAPAHQPIERQQVEQPHERLGPLHGVGHRLGLQGVKQPRAGR